MGIGPTIKDQVEVGDEECSGEADAVQGIVVGTVDGVAHDFASVKVGCRWHASPWPLADIIAVASHKRAIVPARL